MLRTWETCRPTSEEIVRDICRFPAAVDAVIEAKGAKVPRLDNRKGRRQTTKRLYVPPSCPEAEELQAAKFQRLDPMPARSRSRCDLP